GRCGVTACPQCGADAGSGTRFCRSCGAPVGAAPGKVVTPRDALPPIEPQTTAHIRIPPDVHAPNWADYPRPASRVPAAVIVTGVISVVAVIAGIVAWSVASSGSDASARTPVTVEPNAAGPIT